jgi:hypothetical protein
MRAIILFLVLSIPALGFSQYSRKVGFEELRIDSTAIWLDSVLILGTGSSATRIFLNELTGLLNDKFKSSKVVSIYREFGKTDVETAAIIDSARKQGYDAILVFRPQGKSTMFTDAHYESMLSTVILNGGVRQAHSHSIYEQDFKVVLFSNKDTKKAVWSAALSVETGRSVSGAARKTANLIISSFEKNRYLQ